MSGGRAINLGSALLPLFITSRQLELLLCTHSHTPARAHTRTPGYRTLVRTRCTSDVFVRIPGPVSFHRSDGPALKTINGLAIQKG